MVRSFRAVAIVFLLLGVVALCTTASAQPIPGGAPPEGGGGFGMGGPGASMGGIQSPFVLLAVESVERELNLTDEQKATIRAINEKGQAATRKAFEGLRDLDPEDRQQKMAEMRKTIQSQRGQLNKALDDTLQDNQRTRLWEIYVQLRGEQALREAEIQEALGLSDDQKAKIRSPLAILSEDQKAAFEKMKGKPFDVSTIRVGGFGAGWGDRRRAPAAKEGE